MKGLVFNLLETVVSRRYGEDTWDALLDAAELGGAYTSLGNYPDAQMGALVTAASTALNLSPNEVLRWFGQEAMSVMVERYPEFFSAQTTTRPFVLSLNSIIHPEVRKLYPGADVPLFDFEDGPDGSLLMGYDSARKLCALAQGFVEGAGKHFGEVVRFEHLECMHKGDVKCRFRITFTATRKA